MAQDRFFGDVFDDTARAMKPGVPKILGSIALVTALAHWLSAVVTGNWFLAMPAVLASLLALLWLSTWRRQVVLARDARRPGPGAAVPPGPGT